jgi:hypothetical protein
VVADSTYAVIELLKQVSDMPAVSLITRLRLDAALYAPLVPRKPGQNGRPRKKAHVAPRCSTCWLIRARRGRRSQ